MKKQLLFTVLVSLALQLELLAQPGTLDLTFDADGMLITNTSASFDDVANACIVQPNGKIIVAGYLGTMVNDYAFNVIRLHSDGSIDSTFNGTGKYSNDFGIGYGQSYSAALQTDGKILLGGYSRTGTYKDFTILRLDSNGILDLSFDMDGMVTTSFPNHDAQGFSLAIQDDGKIILAGFLDSAGRNLMAIARYNPDGSPDNSFSGDGKTTTAFNNGDGYIFKTHIQNDGKIVAAGYFEDTDTYYADFALVRYNIDGSLDSSFNDDGKVTTDFSAGQNDYCWTMTILPNGNIMAVGVTSITANSDFTMVRYLNNGSIDSSFGTNGLVATDIAGTNDSPSSICIQPDHKILLAGYSVISGGRDFSLVRYSPEGVVDSSFNLTGRVTTHFGSNLDAAGSIALQPDLKIIAAGSMHNGLNKDFAIARYISGLNLGLINFTIKEDILIYPNPITQTAILEYSLTQQEEISIDLINSEGKLFSHLLVNQIRDAGEHQEKIMFPTEMPNGIYFMVISNKTGKVSVKLVK